MTKDECKEKLELIREKSEAGNFVLTANVSNWENYGKSRTYFSIVETRPNSKHYKKFDFGYWDNKEEKYVTGKSSLEQNFTTGGSRF